MRTVRLAVFYEVKKRNSSIYFQINSETFAQMIKLQTATALFKQGKISSGMAAGNAAYHLC